MAPFSEKPKESGENVTDKRFKKVLGKRDAVTESIGFPDGFGSEVLSLCFSISHNSAVTKELGDREKASGLMEWWKDKRGRGNKLLSVVSGRGVPMFKVREDTVQSMPTSSLQMWKERLERDINIGLEKLKKLPSLEESELTDEIKLVLKKYGKSSLTELLSTESGISQDDLELLAFGLSEGVVYRNRKINEFAGYVFARSAPLDSDMLQFIQSANAIVYDGSSGEKSVVRNTELEGANFPALPKALVQPAIASFAQFIEKIEVMEDPEERLRQCTRLYLLLEVIHPFKDGNGRTGRTLFAYLQRRFSGDQYAIPIHVPISRLTSGTHTSKLSDRYDHASLGSLAADMFSLSNKLLGDKKIMDVIKQTKSEYTDRYVKKEDFEEIAGASREVLNRLYQELCSEESNVKLDRLLEAVKAQSEKEDLSDSEWSRIFAEYKKV